MNIININLTINIFTFLPLHLFLYSDLVCFTTYFFIISTGFDTELPVQVPLQQAVNQAKSFETTLSSVLNGSIISFSEYEILAKKVF